MGKRKKGGLRFVQVHHWVMDTAAWVDLSLGARAAYLEIKRLYNGTNNGRLALGSREAGHRLGVSKTSAARFLVELENHGFIERTKPSSFAQKKLSVEWALTEHYNDETASAAARAFRNWRPANAARASNRGDARLTKIQKPVPEHATIVPPTGQPAPISMAMGGLSTNGGTVVRSAVKRQSHQRDTYTSAPEGIEKLRERILEEAREFLCTREGGARSVTWLEDACQAIANALVSEVAEDPLVSLVLSSFPGSTPRIDNSRIERYATAYTRPIN